MAGADYGFISFSGHGRLAWDRVNPVTALLLHDGSEIRAADLNPNIERCSIVIDACRFPVLYQPPILQYIREHAKIARKLPTLDDYRGAFDRTIERASPGVCEVFSCSPMEFALEHPDRGGVFTQCLISQAIDWEANATGWNRTQNYPQAFLRAFGKNEFT